MNIYIVTDLEGISGIYCKEQVDSSLDRFAEGRRYLTREVNICAEALHDAGVDKVYVQDGHGNGGNLLWDQLSPAVDLVICGNTEGHRYQGIEDCDAVILLGYHAMAGTPGAILEHTMSSRSIQNYWLNGVKIGEFALDAAILTEYGKPVIMVSGDDAVCREAKSFLPSVTAVEVKKAAGCNGGALLPPHQTEKLIRDGVHDAVESFKNGDYGFYETEKPVHFRVEYTERTRLPLPAARPYMTFIDGRTVEVVSDSVEDAFFKTLY